MNLKHISLALASLALVSTGSAYAQGISASVGPVGVAVDTGATLGGSLLGPVGPLPGAPTVLSYPAVYEDNTCSLNTCATERRGLFGTTLLGGLFGRRQLFARTGVTSCGVQTMSAVVAPVADCNNPCGPTRGLGQRMANPMFDVSLFGLGLSAGKVNPRYDMRPIGF